MRTWPRIWGLAESLRVTPLFAVCIFVPSLPADKTRKTPDLMSKAPSCSKFLSLQGS